MALSSAGGCPRITFDNRACGSGFEEDERMDTLVEEVGGLVALVWTPSAA